VYIFDFTLYFDGGKYDRKGTWGKNMKKGKKEKMKKRVKKGKKGKKEI
jgi:hypothetical protein